MEASTKGATIVSAGTDRAHPAWAPVFAGWAAAGLARELDPRAFGAWLVHPPTAELQAAVLTAHYHAGSDPVERAWRAQSDRVLEVPDRPLTPEALASASQIVLPEVRVATRRNVAGLELRIAPDRAALETTRARVLLRRMQRHARRGVARPISIEGLPPRSFVYALNVLLASQDVALRFVPLVALPGRRAYVAMTQAQALRLEALGTLATDEPWRSFARFADPLALAS